MLLDRRNAIVSLCGVALPTAWARAANSGPAAQPQLWPRAQPTPALSLPTLDGGVWNLSWQRDQVVLLNFWASWCEPCTAEMPALQALAQRYGPQGLVVAAVNHREPVARVRRFVADTQLRLPILLDTDGQASRGFGVRIYPTTVVVDRRGRAAFRIVGETNWSDSESEQWLSKLM